MGWSAGNANQSDYGIAVGAQAGQSAQQQYATAVGFQAGLSGQNREAVAIGRNAGQFNQGTQAIAIGSYAGQTSQVAGSIILNASGSALNITQAGFFVRPIRGVATTTPVVVYNTTTRELTYNTSSIKYKKNVTDLRESTENIYLVQPREFDSRSDDSHHIGFIAEELNAIDPLFTWKNSDGTPEGIEWMNLLVYTIAEMKKLRTRVDTLEQALAAANSS